MREQTKLIKYPPYKLKIMNNITSTESLKTSIFNATPNADLTAIEELCLLTRKHNLKWVARKDGTDAYYIMSQLSESKGLDSKDYVNHWANKANLTSNFKGEPSEPLSGKSLLLKGEELARFKTSYEEIYGESLGRINSLWVGNWQHSYAYLVQGRTQVAKDFQNLGSKSIEKLVLQDIQPIKIDENTLQKQIIELASYSNINFKFEVGVKNTFYTPDEASHRRWDWIERLPKVTKIYELKSHTLTEQDVRVTIFDKHYVELAFERYPGKPIEIIFCSPKGISWEAKTLIKELMNNQEGYVNLLGVKVKITFMDLQNIAQRLVTNFIESSPMESWFWLLNKLRTEDLQYVVSPRTVAKLNDQITEGYRTGKLIKKSNVVQLRPYGEVAA
jgi:hypothetical protein